MHPEQINEYLRRTGDGEGVKRTVAAMYQAWKQKGIASAVSPVAKVVPGVPVVESAGNAPVSAGKVIDYSRFGELDDDAQAKAFIDAGIV